MERVGSLHGQTFAIVDVETSGTGRSDRIIEIGILRIENGVCVETYKTFLNPERELSPWITQLTGIVQADLEDAPFFIDVANDVARLLKGAIFVAHNVAFDYAFIKSEFARIDRFFESQCLCTVRLSRLLSPRAKHHNLSAVIRRHKLTCESRHRAFDDAHALWQFMQWGHKRKAPVLARSITKLLQTDRTQEYFRARRPEYSEGERVIR
jgi:DNA polymerase III subunit epsilon